MEQNEAPQGQEAMPESNETPQPMDLLLEQEGLNLDFPKQGEIRTGVIASITDNEILVSIGTKSEGIIPGREKDQIPPEELAELEVGMEIPVYVVNPEDSSGALVLSYSRAREESDWLLVEQMLESGDVYESKIAGFNKGGLIVPVGKLRGFVPGSQISVWRRPSESGGETAESRWSGMVGEDITVKVIEVDRKRHRLILSERSALQETRETIKERLLDELEEGTVRAGRITSLADFGAFVNIDGADGLVHLSEISWDHVGHPSEVLKVGQEVNVKIIAVDRERKRIGLSIRQTEPDPWMKRIDYLREGQLIEGVITHLTKFGAFARLAEDLEGLIHISELSESRINHPKEVVKEGDALTLRIIRIDPERRRIGLSLRKVDSPAYTDLDWKMALATEVDSVRESAEGEKTPALKTQEEESAAPPQVAVAFETGEELPQDAAAFETSEESPQDAAIFETGEEPPQDAVAFETGEEPPQDAAIFETGEEPPQDAVAFETGEEPPQADVDVNEEDVPEQA
jgi:small subunit ribosomal protein S1